jgi:transcriptional regulator with XRE-family HTH domain
MPAIGWVASILATASASTIPECQPRAGLPNFFAKLEAGGAVRIAYLGGSITDAWGWRDFSRQWFAEQYPQAQVSEIRATISGTGAEFGACRLGDHVLRHSPDLVFVEFAVNGAGATDKRAIESVEGIIRQIRRHDPKIDICLVFTLSSGMVSGLKEGRSPQVVMNMKKVADHYGVSTVDFGPEVVRLMASSPKSSSGTVRSANQAGPSLKCSSPRRKEMGVVTMKGKHPARQATLRDIATATNLTVATVSRILAGKAKFAPETRERVEAVANALGYRPNRLVAGIQTGRTGMIGCITGLIVSSLPPRCELLGRAGSSNRPPAPASPWWRCWR